MARFRLPATAAVGAIPVRLIRALDRRGGFSARRGEGTYARVAPWFASRLHRSIAREVVASLGDRPGATIVDLGSGPGFLALELGRQLPSAVITGVEPNPQMRAIAARASRQGNVRFVDGSAEHLPFPDGTVDLVVSSLSAHHWDDLEASVREIRRVLRSSGTAWIHDVRFATFTVAELEAVGRRLGLPPGSIRRSVPRGQGLLPFTARIDIDPVAGRTVEPDP